MRKKFISVCIAVISAFSIYGCAQTTEDTLAADAEIVVAENIDAADTETENIETENTETGSEEEKDNEGAGATANGEKTATSEATDNRSETDMESSDILREIEEYRSHFIGLYTNNALSDEFPDLEPGMIIEEHDIPSDNGEGESVTVYSDLSGKKLRYELHYYGETGNSVINYYLCDNFVWVSRQYNHYSSMTLRAEYSDVLYSTIENWIITDAAAYTMHDNGELEETDKTQLENEIPMPDEIKAMEMGYSQADTIADIKDITWEAAEYNVV